MRKELTEIVGREHIAIPDSGAWEVSPGTIEETSAVVGLAHGKGWNVAPRGAGTRADPAVLAEPPDLVVSTLRLSRVREHSPDDLVATVECGISLGDLQAALAPSRQWLPLNPECSPASTLGGVLATNAFGSLRLGHGAARDLVIGCELVRFDGAVVRAGGRVVKNVSGYDLTKLYLGSWGAFGILVSASLKLAPRPGSAREILRRPDSRREAYEWTAGLAQRGFPLRSAAYEEGTLAIGFALPPESLDLPEDGPRPGPKPPPPPPPALSLRLSYPPGCYVEVMEALEGTIPGSRETSLLLSGVTWLHWETAPTEREGARMVERIDEFLAPLEGHVCAERMPMEWVPAVPRWRAPADAARLMARLKAALDPDGVFPALPGVARKGVGE